MRSLQIKFSALVVTLLVVASVSLAVIATQHERGALEAEVEKRGRAVAKHLAGAAKEALLSVEQGDFGHELTLEQLVEDKLARAQVIEIGGNPPETVRFGVTVVLVDDSTGEEVRYTITGEEESDVSAGLISVTSPVARALLGKRAGDEVTVRVPKGNRSFEVLEIRFD